MMRLVSLILFIAVYPSAAGAWGADGHRAIARIALACMSNDARQRAFAMLGGEQEFIAASIWADQVRKARPESAPWHYINIPYVAGTLDLSTQCQGGNCVVAKLDEFARAIGDASLIQPIRVEALKWVIHLVGDLHQPLHVSDDGDRGGNTVWVRIGGETAKLHAWWDTGLLAWFGDSDDEMAEWATQRVTTAEVERWAGGATREWTMEAFTVARDFVYARSRGSNTRSTPIVLPESYVADAEPILQQQLAKAGVRLARTLDEAFHVRASVACQFAFRRGETR